MAIKVIIFLIMGNAKDLYHHWLLVGYKSTVL